MESTQDSDSHVLDQFKNSAQDTLANNQLGRDFFASKQFDVGGFEDDLRNVSVFGSELNSLKSPHLDQDLGIKPLS